MPPSLYLTDTHEGTEAVKEAGAMAFWAESNFEIETEALPPVRAIPVCGFTSEEIMNEELQLVQKLFFLAGDAAPRVVVFCGVEATDRADLVCARTAEILARLVKEPVCLMDANFNSPTLHSRYEIDRVLPIVDRTPENEIVESRPENALKNNKASGPYLWILPAGIAEHGHPALTPDQLRDRLSSLQKVFSFLLICAPPLDDALDGFLLGQMADGVVLTVQAHSTHRATALKVSSNLKTYNVRVLGAVLNQEPG